MCRSIAGDAALDPVVPYGGVSQMGSPSSGPVRTTSLAWTLPECRCIEIGDVVRAGLLDHRRAQTRFRWRREDHRSAMCDVMVQAYGQPVSGLRLIYRPAGSDEYLVQDVPITRSRLISGGLRPWLLCPVCGSRVRVVAMPPDALGFGCRHCLAIAPPSKRDRA